ncbi:hypothetical protein CROQUDRAFT_108116 [Cronartium quercuum f. sp. fusiforme G11]|uniref:Uncharacterized protein n=1 Tax=Cronartium quercuum f. sp. fusiforme G11 TaxID=708437 RepID=A0A9P6NE15_9BASI|nr:hypothetical protein CROQUDRAFT_108116 [Cronartium quercuum f. sp. fusiforme G11]
MAASKAPHTRKFYQSRVTLGSDIILRPAQCRGDLEPISVSGNRLPKWVNPVSELGFKNLLDLNIQWFWEKCAKSRESKVKQRVNKMFYSFWKTHEIAAEMDLLSEENLKLQMRRGEELSAKLPIETGLSPLLKHQINGFYYLASLLLHKNVNLAELEIKKQPMPPEARKGTLHVRLKAWLQYPRPRRTTHYLILDLYMSWLRQRREEFFMTLNDHELNTIQSHIEKVIRWDSDQKKHQATPLQ